MYVLYVQIWSDPLVSEGTAPSDSGGHCTVDAPTLSTRGSSLDGGCHIKGDCWAPRYPVIFPRGRTGSHSFHRQAGAEKRFGSCWDTCQGCGSVGGISFLLSAFMLIGEVVSVFILSWE